MDSGLHLRLFDLMKYFSFLIVFSFINTAWACPGCIGSNPKDQYLVYILGAFILLTYFPLFYLFKLIKKHKNLNALVTEEVEAINESK
jgi:phosphotransferase system  glucose/maltose/N-acetylglucosamine-specific IIC component